VTSDDATLSPRNFTGTCSREGAVVIVALDGEADVAALTLIDQLLAQADALAQEHHAAFVALDVARLRFISASCLSKIIAWINRVRRRDESARYQIKLRYNQNVHWQRRSLAALQCFAVDLISIEG
jgi:hypothetical protein